MLRLVVMLLLLIGGWIGLRLISGQHFKWFIAKYKFDFPLLWMAPVSLLVEQSLHLSDKFSGKTPETRRRLKQLYGHQVTIPTFRMFVAQCISVMYLVCLLSIILAILDHGNLYVFMIGSGVAICCPWLLGQQLQQLVKKKQRAIILELPEFLNKVILLVNAGEPVQKAVIQCSAGATRHKHHPLYVELNQLAKDLDNHVVFSHAMDQFNARCSVQEISVFCTTVLMNHRRGGEHFVESLRALNRQLWEKRKALTKILGEEASAKLVFPMVIIFAVIMVIVAAPAVMLLNQS